MGETPSPASVAGLYAAQARRPLPGQAELSLRTERPDLVEEATRFGIDVSAAFDDWESKTDATNVNRMVSPTSSPFVVATEIRDVVAQRGLPLLAYLVAEALLSSRSGAVATYLRSAGTSLERTLGQLSERLGEAFLDVAFTVTWQRPVVFRRTLDAARAYLEWTRQTESFAGKEVRPGTKTRIGIATVLAARFGPVAEIDLRHALKMLIDADNRGSDRAMEYSVEASLWLYDLFGDEMVLRDAATRLMLRPESEAAQSIMAAHLWLRLAGTASRPHGVAGFVDRGRKIVDRYPWVAVRSEEAALVLLAAAFDQIEADMRTGLTDLSTRGLLFPFGHRRPDTPTADLFERGLPRLIAALSQSDKAGDFVFRDLTATFCSLHARAAGTSSAEAIRSVRAAIAAREGSLGEKARPLNRPGVEVDQAADRFLLATLTGDEEMRRLGFVELVRASGPEDLKPRYLTMIAKELEEHGALTGGFVPGSEDLALAVREGDSTTIFKAAARAAYQSTDLTQVLLGGRDGVVTLRDSDGIAGQTFVYKRTRPEAMARDRAYSRAVAAELRRQNLGARFGLIEHLTELSDVGLPGDDESIVSVRRFTDGIPLLEHLRSLDADGTTRTLQDVSSYLALIHYAGQPESSSTGVRTDLKERELGRWLRAFQMTDDERMHLFDLWWAVVERAPMVPRRDAHPLNWIIGSDNCIRAVDLESKGVRPFGYELAQLVEDGRVLAPSNYAARDSILQTYLDAWTTMTSEVLGFDQVREWYQAGCLARAARAVSYPNPDPGQRKYGGDLMEALARRDPNSAVGAIASELSRRWGKVTGRVGDRLSKTIPDSGRRRISRAMSHHLRHNSAIPATKEGWVHVDELAETLRAAGHRVSSDQLLFIAGALGEPRFELDGEDIRAAYGHSVPMSIRYEYRRPPAVLFHATPTRNLGSIFEARAGLMPGERNWVHLTESCAVAVDTARRHRAAVSVLEVETSSLKGLVHASGATWLAPTVPIDCLRLLPLRRLDALTRE